MRWRLSPRPSSNSPSSSTPRRIATAADAEAGILTDTAGRYKDLFAGIDDAAAKNPSDLVAQYQKALKDGFVAQAEAHKAEIAAAAKTVTDQRGVFVV
jgi:hypothetical protein